MKWTVKYTTEILLNLLCLVKYWFIVSIFRHLMKYKHSLCFYIYAFLLILMNISSHSLPFSSFIFAFSSFCWFTAKKTSFSTYYTEYSKEYDYEYMIHYEQHLFLPLDLFALVFFALLVCCCCLVSHQMRLWCGK